MVKVSPARHRRARPAVRRRLRRYPGGRRCRRWTRSPRARHDLVARGHPSGRPGRPRSPAGRARPVAVPRRGARRPGAQARRTRATRTSWHRLRELAPDCCPVVAYGALLPQSALDIPPHGWVNLHFSLLPAWRGAAPVQHAIWAGDEVTGATTFRIVEADWTPDPVVRGGDRGDPPRPTPPGTCSSRLAAGGARPARRDPRRHRVRRRWRPARSRPTGSASPRRSPVEDAGSTGTSRRSAVDRRIRACTPGPGAWTTFEGERLKVGPVVIEGNVPALPAGVARGHQERRAGRHRDDAGPARRGAAVRQAADGGGRLGARRARAVRCPVRRRWLTTRPAVRRTTCCAPSASRRPTPTWCCRRCCAPAASATVTRRSRPSWSTGRCGGRGSTTR